MPQKSPPQFPKSHELCLRSVEGRAETTHFIAEARQAIAVSKAALNHLNRLDGPLRGL
ncbi:MAG: hypothetical protein JO282_09520 [Alphaproteobacteria bacterium]|nr:hypothetical protein [Alphaproteobacteria bacterium]